MSKLIEMIRRGQRALDEATPDNPQWREDAEHEMGEEEEYQSALGDLDTRSWDSREEQENYFERPGGQVMPVANDVDDLAQVEADNAYWDYEMSDDWDDDLYDGTAAEELERQEDEHWSNDTSRWDEIAGIEPGEGEPGGWDTTDDGVRVNIPS